LGKISSRVEGVSWSGIREIFETLQARKDVIHLELGEPDFQTPPHIIETAKRALDDGYTHYTSSYGTFELRCAIAEKLKRENGIDADPETEIIVTAGASAATFMVCLAFLEPDDEALIPDPGWPNTFACVSLTGAKPVLYPLHEENEFMPDPNEIQSLITSKTKMIILNSPSNPTGAVFDKVTLKAVAQIAEDEGLTVVSDEVYDRLVYDGEYTSFASLPDAPDSSLTINSLSKTYAMTGWRIGYIVTNKETSSQFAKLNLFLNSCPNSIAQKAAVIALREHQEVVSRMVEEYRLRRDFVVKRLNEMKGIRTLTPRGAFYAFPNISALGKSSREIALHLIDTCGVATVPGSAFGVHGEGHLRIAYANSTKNLQEAMRRIEATLHTS